MIIDPSSNYIATIRTNMGDVVIELYATAAPETVNNFVFLAEEGFYDDVIFHRVIESFMIQGGDPTGTGSGGPGYSFEDEFDSSLVFDRPGILAMANAGPNTNGSQFFITVVPTPHLNGAHTIFGQVLEGQGIADSISKAPSDASGRPNQPVIIDSIEITKASARAAPTPTPPVNPQVVFLAAEVTEETIQAYQNRSKIANEFTIAFLDGQIQDGSVTTFSATTGGSSVLVDVWYTEGLQTGNGFRLGLTSSSEQLGDAAVRQIKGNLFLVVKPAPLSLLPQEPANSGRALLTIPGPAIRSSGLDNLGIALGTGDQPWDQQSLNLKQTTLEPSSQGAAGPQRAGRVGVRPLLHPLMQDAVGIGFGTGEPPGGLLIVQGDQVTLVDETGATLARFEFAGRKLQELVQDVLDSDVQPPNEESIARGCRNGDDIIVSNTSLFTLLWDASRNNTSSGQTIESQTVTSVSAFKNEIYNCKTMKYTSGYCLT